MSPEFPEERFLTAAKAVAFLNDELGIPTSRSTFAKLTMPSRATGPVPAAYWGKRPLFTPSGLRSWAQRHVRTARPAKNRCLEAANPAAD